MKVVTILAAAAAALPAAQAITLNGQKRDGLKVFELDIQRKQAADPVKASNKRFRNRKRGTVSQTLDNEETFYFANITLGTPAQKLRMTLDTGSSDLWVNTPNSTLCSAANSPCSSSGTYDPSDSSTYSYVNSDFNITYADGSSASGDYVKDTLVFGGKTLSDFQFGTGYTSTSTQGVLGIGYGLNEVFVTSLSDTPYDNLPLALVDAGFINVAAYSLWLNDLDSSTGSILFGGVNAGKYTGELQSLPILQESGVYAEFYITLTNISYKTSSDDSSTSVDTDLPAAVLLDSGSSLSYLPDSLVSEIYDAVGAEYSSQSGEAFAPCSLASSGGSINFTFTDPSIEVSFDELLFDVTDSRGNALTFNDGTEACVFGISPSGSSLGVLGDTFLRSAYVVYDLENNEISLAQTDFNSTENEIKEITSGSSGVPGATYVTNAVTTLAAATGAAVNGGSDSSGTSTGFTSEATSSSSTSAAHRLQVSVGQASLGFLAAGAVLIATAL
ncbi:putative aspartic-type endopeptidase [Phaeomoniella chlamydospora]|uniref:Probable aspartic-type endopeptidase OPSB n=1 Tax=Phaeomoniella chlamydospora TaxID=158046 RepID=A0A0G2DX98_PHACM|nr:putative aspartic-type endopeptidase [Phaeomoniella chlamydospora]